MPSSSEPQALKLRQELKDWERAFAGAHGGRKPTREEVKKDANITAKYKEYSKLRVSSTSSQSSSKPSRSQLPPPSSSTLPYEDNPFAPSASQSRTSSAKSTRSIQRRTTTTDDVFKTPSKPYHNDLYDSPLSTRGRRLFGNRPRDTVGPTPQKMGKVLGIFESFVDVETTPTHQRVLRGTPGTGNKRTADRVSASPAGTDAFTTPRKRKAGELSHHHLGSGSGSECDSPTKPAPRDVLSTPSFLRRNNQFAPAAFLDSPPVPQPLRPPVRGLSSMVAELRKMEDDAHGDEEEAMREMEEEMMGPPSLPPLPPSATQPKKPKPAPSADDNDPDTGLPPLPPGAWVDDTLEEEPSSGDEKPTTRKWKKKGLKRQHRRVIMRPVGRITHPSDPNHPPPPPPPKPEEAELPAAGYDDEDLSDLDAPPTEPEPENNDPREAARAKRAKTMAAAAALKSAATAEKTKPMARKISEKAHTNYKRLNIRGSKGAKAGNGGGRFARKRR